MQCISNLRHFKLCHCDFSCSDGGSLPFMFLDRWTIWDSKVSNSWPRSVKGQSAKYRILYTPDCTCYTFKISFISLNLLLRFSEDLFSCFSCRDPPWFWRTRVVIFSRIGSTAAIRESYQVIDMLYLSLRTHAHHRPLTYTLDLINSQDFVQLEEQVLCQCGECSHKFICVLPNTGL